MSDPQQLREKIARAIFNHNAINMPSGVNFDTASERMKRTSREYADALLPLVSEQLAPVWLEGAVWATERWIGPGVNPEDFTPVNPYLPVGDHTENEGEKK